MRKSPDNNDNIENQHQEQESSTDNSELIETRNDQYKLEEEKEKQSETQLTNAERLKQKLMGGDTDETFSNFSKYINYIKDNGQPKDISKELEFLKDSQYIEQTKKEYKEMFEKTKKLLGETDILSKISEISNIKEKGGDVTNNIQDLKRQKVFKNIVKLQKYERGEFVNFPNGISFELCKGKIPGGDTTDYYIQTHVEKNTKYYIEYVDSLLNMRELFKSKGINIKYGHRETRLANREFIEAYEKIRKEKKESEGETYEKSNILKILEQTEQAVICEKPKEINRDKLDKNPIRFLKKGSDLYNFAIGEGKETRLFHETEMWLDLDKLSGNEQEESNISKHQISENQDNGILSEDKKINHEYLTTIIKLIGNDENFKKLLDDEHKLSIKDIENICNNLSESRSDSKKEYLSDNLGSKQDFKDLSKFCYDPKAIEKYGTFNCSGASLLMASLIESLGGKANIVSVYHHVVCLAKIGEKEYLIDTLNNKIEDVTDRLTKNRTEVGYVKKFTVNKPIFGQYSEGYIYDTIAQAEKDIHSGNYLKMYEEKYSKVACELEDLIGKEKIDSYIKEGGHGQSYKSFPEFDRKMYEILDLQGKERSYIGKAKLKIQEFFVKLKRFFAKK